MFIKPMHHEISLDHDRASVRFLIRSKFGGLGITWRMIWNVVRQPREYWPVVGRDVE